jgi:hypothetical protein
LYATDPAQAALSWKAIEVVASGLGNGQILRGLWTQLLGAVGIISIFPGQVSVVRIYGLAQIIWFVKLGIVPLRSQPQQTA